MTSRRTFLKTASLLAAGTPFFGLDLLGRGAAAAPTPGDYKAIICVFLYGGSDCANTVIPYAAQAHAEYYRLRGGDSGIGVPRSRLQPTSITPDLALNPGLRKTAALFRDGKAAVLANIGTLAEPTRKTADGRLVRVANASQLATLPQKLRSHNDQQASWQSFAPESGGSPGWGGRLGDRFIAANGTNKVFTSVSAFGANIFGNGVETSGYQFSPPSGALRIEGIEEARQLFGSDTASAELRSMLTSPVPNQTFANDLNNVRRRSIESEAILSGVLPGTTVGSFFPPTGLGAQLALVSRAMQAGQTLGLRRQVFLVGLGGFDHHDDLYGIDGSGNPLEGSHEYLLSQLDDGLDAIHRETVRLGIDSKVTTFTMSDFGRTLTSNGDGSDHGWGSHQLVVGGAVRGNAVYGTMPDVTPTDPAYLDRGVLLPTTSVDQLANTLARWFGVPQSERALVTPNISSFTEALGTPQNLGFLT